MRILRVAIILLDVCACGAPSPPGPAVRLAGDVSDTIIINSRWPRALPVHAFDARGRTVVGAPIRFERVDGATVPVTKAGAVTCNSSGDLGVRAVLKGLTTRVLVRCRLVEHVQIQGPIQFILGDSELSRPRTLPLGVYSADGRPVSLFTASISLGDNHVATLQGTTLYPRSRGITIVGVHIGDREGAAGVHIYQRVDGPDALDTLLRVDPHQRAFAVPLRLESGTQYRQLLPPGQWMLALLSKEDSGPNPIRMGVDGAACQSNLLNDPGRLECEAGARASVVAYRRPGSRAPATGYLLVRWAGGGNPSRFVPRVPATPGSLVCANEFLGERGYEVRQVSHDQQLLHAERRETRLGTAARREWIEVRFVPDAADTTLRARAWAVDSYPPIEGRPRARDPVVVEPAEVTLTDAREALQKCGRSP